jgi:ankyrin repeat protein
MESFKYEPLSLDRAEFRLVRILPGEENDDLECELICVDFDIPEEQIPYDALSYVWGSSTTSNEIMVDGKTLPVTSNLYSALWHLRTEDEPRYMWIDAIAINQSNKEECGHQVQQMADIYKSAQNVVIWLGTTTMWQVKVLMKTLKRVEEKSRQFACRSWAITDHRWRTLWSEALNELEKTASGLKDGLITLLSRAWWSRVWILQEVANARTATIMCGPYSVSARIFALAPQLLQLKPESHCQAVLDIFPGPSRERSWWNQNRDLKTLLCKFGDSKASDPRDNVYALLGLSLDAYKSSHLVVNYKINLDEVIKQALSFILRYHNAQIQLQRLPEGFIWTDFPRNLEALSTALLRQAVEENRAQEVDLLLSQDVVNANAVDSHGRTPLYVGALSGLKDIVDLFFQKRTVSANPVDTHGRTLLSRLAEKGDHEGIRQIISRPNVDILAHDSDGRRPLWYAIENNHVEAADILISQGCIKAGQSGIEPDRINLNASSPNKIPPTEVHIVHTAELSMIRYLIGITGVNWKDEHGRSILSHSAELGIAVVVKFLLGFDDIEINTHCSIGRTPLSFAAEKGYDVVVQLLLQKTAIDPNAHAYEHMTPLCYAAEFGHLAVVKLLLKSDKTVVNHKSTSHIIPVPVKITPLTRAVMNGHNEVAKLLCHLDHSDVNSHDSMGFAPLHHAVFSMAEAADTKWLPEKDSYWKDFVVDWPNCDLIEHLQRKEGIDINIKSREGRTPLSYAAGSSSLRAVQALLRSDAIDAGAKDSSGKTALWYAAYYGRAEIVSLLLNREDVDVFSEDKDGHTPFDVANAGVGWTTDWASANKKLAHHQASPERAQQVLELMKNQVGSDKIRMHERAPRGSRSSRGSRSFIGIAFNAMKPF